jgi:hypothetical protein
MYTTLRDLTRVPHAVVQQRAGDIELQSARTIILTEAHEPSRGPPTVCDDDLCVFFNYMTER